MTSITKLFLLTFTSITLLLGCGSIQIMNTAQQASVYQFTIIMQGNQYTPQQKEWMTRQACYDLGYQWALGQGSYPAFNNPEFDNIRKIEVAATQGLVNLNRVNCLHHAIQRYRLNEDQKFNTTTIPGNTTPMPQVPEKDIRKLMGLGADINYPGNLGKRRTPLFYAAGSVVEYGADQNFKYYRSHSTQLYVMLVLLGARDDIVDSDGFTPKHIFMEVYYPKQLQQAYMYNTPSTPSAQYPAQPAPQTTTQVNQQYIDQQYALIMLQTGKNNPPPPTRIINNFPSGQIQDQMPVTKQVPSATAQTALTQTVTTQTETQSANKQLIQDNKQNKNLTNKKEKLEKQQINKESKAERNKNNKKSKQLDVIRGGAITSTTTGIAASSAGAASTATTAEAIENKQGSGSNQNGVRETASASITTAPSTPTSQIENPVIVPVTTQTTQEESPAAACYKIEMDQFFQSANPREAPVGSSQPGYSIAAYKRVYCVDESEDNNHRDKNKNVVTQYLQIRKLDAKHSECKFGEKQGVFNSQNEALKASSKTFPQLKQHHCDSYNRW